MVLPSWRAVDAGLGDRAGTAICWRRRIAPGRHHRRVDLGDELRVPVQPRAPALLDRLQRERSCGSTRRTTTCWPRKRGWRVSWRLRWARCRTSTGSRWAARRCRSRQRPGAAVVERVAFEYLMPLLVMRAYPNTLIEETCQVVIDRQIEYARGFGVAWGISESAYNLRDHDGNYQYRAFGVPGLGLKRGLGDDLVVAPYASLLACSLRPRAVAANLDAIERDSPRGRFGYRDAVDYTGTRLPKDARFARGRHLHGPSPGHDPGGDRQRRQRRQPCSAGFTGNRESRRWTCCCTSGFRRWCRSAICRWRRCPTSGPHGRCGRQPVRRYRRRTRPGPRGHLLSNGRYSVMLSRTPDRATAAAASHADAMARGSHARQSRHVLLRPRRRGRTRPGRRRISRRLSTASEYEAIFAPDRATFRRRDGTIELHTEIAVSPEDDVELRRVSISTNRPRGPRTWR